MRRTKQSLGNVGFEWYPYDTLSALGHLEKLLTGANRGLLDCSGRVLDVGSQDGELAFFLESLGYQVVAVDHPAYNHNGMRGIRALKAALGSAVEIMTPEHHDIVLAITSHIPHLIAYNIVGTASDLEQVTSSEVIKFSAGGFRDFTRIASSDPVMWRDVFLNNKPAVLEVLGRFTEDLSALQRMIRWDDGEALLELFTRTRAIRRGIIEAGQDTPEADFGRPHGHEE